MSNKPKANDMTTSKVVSAEIIDTMTNQGCEYSGQGNFRGNVLVETTHEDGSVSQKEIDGEHSEKDMLVNYASAEYWNE